MKPFQRSSACKEGNGPTKGQHVRFPGKIPRVIDEILGWFPAQEVALVAVHDSVTKFWEKAEAP